MNIKIGIADDHAFLLQTLEQSLNNITGFSVIVTACNGRELIRQISENDDKPDVVLLDIKMPVMDGFQTAAYLQEQFPDIRKIAFSTYDNTAIRLEMQVLGCLSYIPKGISLNEMIDIIREVYYR